MKNKIFIFFALVVFLFSCTKNFQEFNTDQKNPANVSGESLFSNGELTLVDQVSSTNVNLNVFKLFTQQWTETTYTDEANYDVVNRGIPDLTFRQYYRGFLQDFQEAKRLIGKTSPSITGGKPEKTNKFWIIDLLQVYSYQNLVDIFGNVPYTSAMNIDTIAPRYDDAKTIYSDLIRRVNVAIDSLDPAAPSFGSADLIYGGDVTKWIKFANSLKVKLGITIADVEPALSSSTIESAVTAGVFTSAADNAQLAYLSAIHTNPLYQELVLTGRQDFVPANTLVDLMNSLNDPRRQYYFTQIGGQYKGGAYGYTSPYAQYSHIANAIMQPTFPGILLTYDEILFYLAEAAARGYNVGGTPDALYNAAVTQSFLWWGGTPAEAAAYLAQPNVSWASPGSGPTWKEKIATQAYIAFYTRGLEAWTEWRRLDFPVLNVPPLAEGYSSIPKRFPYPVNEQTLNKSNYDAAVQAIGGHDDLTTRIFWDVADPVQP
jgi:hypothetical protein